MKRRLILMLLLLSAFSTFGQTVQEHFTNGFENLENNKIENAKVDFNYIIKLAPEDYGGYNFYGICLFKEQKFDSAIYYLQKSIELNRENNNHSKEMTAARLLRTYIYLAQFEKAFDLAYKFLKEYPENPNLKSELKDVCLWSYYISYESLSKEYLSNQPKKEYTVTNIPQEYLIMRNIKINDRNLYFKGQGLNLEKKQDYLNCGINKTDDSVKLIFNLNWDITKEFGGKFYDSKKVYENTKNPIYERIGALLVDDKKIDLLTEIERIKK